MKKYFGLCFLLLFFLSLCSAAMDAGAAAALPEKLLRLRVVAASDAPEDQARKLLVRDEVVGFLAPLLEECRDLREAAAITEASLPELVRRAETRLRAAGGTDTVTARLGPEQCPLRNYGSFSLPAGTYESLTLTLGEGEGRNWWCVVFPPLCLSAAGEEGEDSFAVFSPEETRLLTAGDRQLRFRCLELWQQLLAWLRPEPGNR
jgi:stage II sporulation protein R